MTLGEWLPLSMGILSLRYLYWVLVERRLVAVDRQFLFQSGAMSQENLLRTIKRHHIDTVIDFRRFAETPGEPEAVFLASLGVRYVRLPCDRAPDPSSINTFLRVCREERQAGHRMLIHCKDGEGRAVFFGALYRVEFMGESPKQAYLNQRRLPSDLMWCRFIVPNIGLFSAKNPKAKLLLEYRQMPATVDELTKALPTV